jgi:hypothetical protein
MPVIPAHPSAAPPGAGLLVHEWIEQIGGSENVLEPTKSVCFMK